MPRVLFEGSSLRVMGRSIGKPRLFVTFDHWKRDRVGFPDYRPAKLALEQGFGHLSIQTARNDWFLNDETDALRAYLARFCQGKECLSIGFSMGGYGALLFANELQLRRVLLISTQYSIFPHNAPYETSYRKEAALIDPSLDQLDPITQGPALQGIVVYDPRLCRADRCHADKIRALHPGIRPVALPFGGHPAMKNFDGAGVYPEIMRAFLEDDLSPEALRGVHRLVGRSSPRYKQRLKAYLAKRRTRIVTTP